MNAPRPGRLRVAPNRNALGLLALLLAMWYAGASQSNGAAYLLAFVLAGMALVSLLHAGANLRGLHLDCGMIRPTFAGEIMHVPMRARAASGRTHLAIRLTARTAIEPAGFEQIRDPEIARTELLLRAPRRGSFASLRVEASSLYPLGFFTARRSTELPQPHYIYPAPEGPLPLPQVATATDFRGSGVRLEGDDFAGLRAYVPGEPQRHIDWKAVARGQGLVIKQWSGEADETVALRWADTAPLGYEARLSQLARWLLLAERQGRSYTLEIPGTRFSPGRGELHLHECLRALAVFPLEEAR